VRAMQYQMQYRSDLRLTQAIDFAIWRALGHSRVSQRTTPLCVMVLLLTRGAVCLVYRGGGAASIAPVVVTVRYSAESKNSAAVLYGVRLNKNAQGQSSLLPDSSST